MENSAFYCGVILAYTKVFFFWHQQVWEARSRRATLWGMTANNMLLLEIKLYTNPRAYIKEVAKGWASFTTASSVLEIVAIRTDIYTFLKTFQKNHAHRRCFADLPINLCLAPTLLSLYRDKGDLVCTICTAHLSVSFRWRRFARGFIARSSMRELLRNIQVAIWFYFCVCCKEQEHILVKCILRNIYT